MLTTLAASTCLGEKASKSAKFRVLEMFQRNCLFAFLKIPVPEFHYNSDILVAENQLDPSLGWMSYVFTLKQGVALTKRNTTGPPWSVGRPTARTPGGRPTRPPALLQTTNNDDKRQRAKQYWPIRRASNKI